MAKSPKPGIGITREQFTTHARPVKVVINGKEFEVARKEFSTGSLGWYLNDKMEVEIDGVKVKVQIGLNLTVVGSKELPRDASSAPPPPAPNPTPTENTRGEADF